MSTKIITQHYEANQHGNKSSVALNYDSALPKQYIKIVVTNAVTHLTGRWRYTDFEIKVKTNIASFKEESSVRRRFSDFLWLNDELKKLTLIALPELPNKKVNLRSIPFLNKLEQSNFDPEFIEQRRVQLEQFINKIAEHPLAQNQKCLHMFLQEQFIDRRYKPGTV